jgi:glycosyltransferase involved in cell wall biosynthesis
LDLSILIPVKDEAENVGPLCDEIVSALAQVGKSYEIIFVDDGSTDGTVARLKEIQQSSLQRVRVLILRRNFGQTAALSAALDIAQGQILIPMDGDRQNDPADIPRLIAKLDEGFDVVSGWRKDRKDRFVTRKLPSWIANKLVARLSGLPLHDFGCTLSARGARRRAALWRDAPVHSDFRFLARREGG